MPDAELSLEAEDPLSPISSFGGPVAQRLEDLHLFDNPLFSTAAATVPAAAGVPTYNMATDYMATGSSAQRPPIPLWNGKTGMDYKRWSYAHQTASKGARNKLNSKKDADLH